MVVPEATTKERKVRPGIATAIAIKSHVNRLSMIVPHRMRMPRRVMGYEPFCVHELISPSKFKISKHASRLSARFGITESALDQALGVSLFHKLLTQLSV